LVNFFRQKSYFLQHCFEVFLIYKTNTFIAGKIVLTKMRSTIFSSMKIFFLHEKANCLFFSMQ